MRPFLNHILFSDSDFDSDLEDLEFMGFICQLIDILPAIEAEEQRAEQEARRPAKCRKRAEEKFKAETEHSRRRNLAKEKEQAEAESSKLRKRAKENAEAESSRLRKRAKEKSEAESSRWRKYAQNCIARDCEEVSGDRRKCSEEISSASSSKIIYAGAVLDVCYWKLGFYPEVVSFVQHEMVNFSSVKGQYSYNEPPKLIMLDDAGQCKEIIRIDNWKYEHILQFLRENLKPTSRV